MKITQVIALGVTVGIIAFLVGRWNAGSSLAEEMISARPNTVTTSRSSSKVIRETRVHRKQPSRSSIEPMTLDEARLLSSEQRMQLIANGGRVFGSRNQIAALTNIIGALTKDEMKQAADTLGEIQDRGNFQTQEVWDTLWKQWGRVDPVVCLAFFGSSAVSKSNADARNVMAGWLETDPDAALAWANEPKKSALEASAAALAITNAANGNLKQMENAIAALPAESPLVRRQCLRDYFDAAILSEENATPATIYESTPPAMRQDAWPVALNRMTLQDPKAAAKWFEQNLGSADWNSGATHQLVYELSNRDPVAAIQWVEELSGGLSANSSPGSQERLLGTAYNYWMQRDPEAARAWLRTQAADSPLSTRFNETPDGNGR